MFAIGLQNNDAASGHDSNVNCIDRCVFGYFCGVCAHCIACVGLHVCKSVVVVVVGGGGVCVWLLACLFVLVCACEFVHLVDGNLV